MWPRRRQKPSQVLVVAGGCRGLLLPCVQDSVLFLLGNFIHVTILFVSNRHSISLSLGCDVFHMYRSVIPYVFS